MCVCVCVCVRLCIWGYCLYRLLVLMFRSVLACVNVKLFGSVHAIAMLYIIVCMCGISTNSVDERGECIHPSSTTSPWAHESFFCVPLIFCLFLSDTVLMPVPVPRCVPLSAVAFIFRSS